MNRTLLAPAIAHRGLVLLVASLCSALIVGATLTGWWLHSSADTMAAAAFSRAGHQATQLQVTYVGVQQGAVGDDAPDLVADALPATLQSTLGEARHVVTTTEMVPTVLPRRPGEPAFLSVGAVPGIRSLVDLVDGRRPEPGSAVRRLPAKVAAEYDGPANTSVVEVMLEESAASEMDTPIGSWVVLTGQSYSPDEQRPAALLVVGTFRATDPYPSPLDDLDALRKPLVSDLAEYNLVRATALAADEETVLNARWEDLPDVRFAFDLDGTPSAAETSALVTETRRATLQTWPPVLDALTVDAGTGLGTIAQTAVDQRTTSNGLLALTLTALAASGLTVLLAASMVLGARRRAVTEVMRARGAGLRSLTALRGTEALLLTMPGVLLSVALLAVLSPAETVIKGAAVTLASAAVTALVVTAAQTVPAPSDQMRLVARDGLQLGVVLLAAAAVALVLTGEGIEASDPVMLLLAPLLGTAAAVVILRALQAALAPARLLTWRGRAATALVGLGQSAALIRQLALPVTALVLAVSAGVYAISVDDSLRAGATQAGWEQVGADVTISANGLNDEVVDQVSELSGIDAVAPIFTAGNISAQTRRGLEGVTVIGVDADLLSRAAGESMPPLELPPREGGVITGVASPDLQLTDSALSLRYAQAQVPVEVIRTQERIPGVTEGGSYVLVDRDALAEAVGRPLDLYTHVLIAGSPDPAAVAEVARTRTPQAVVTTRTRLAEDTLAGPVVDRTLTLTPVAAVAALVLAVFAILLGVSLGAPVRRQAAQVFALLGGGRRQAHRAGILGLLPVIVAACLTAAACGLLLSMLAGSGVDVTTLTNTIAPVPVRPAATSSTAVLAVLAGLVLVAALASRARRTSVPSDPEAP